MKPLRKYIISTIVSEWFKTLPPWEAYLLSVHYAMDEYKAGHLTITDYSTLLYKIQDLLVYIHPPKPVEIVDLTVGSLQSMLRNVNPDYRITVTTEDCYYSDHQLRNIDMSVNMDRSTVYITVPGNRPNVPKLTHDDEEDRP